MSPFSIPPTLAPDIERVEQIVAARTSARPIVAALAGRHLGDAHGRLRAVLVLLAARLGGEQPARADHAAAAVLLIYAAAQVHAELINEGDRRRENVGAHPRWGGSAMLMVGDYLLALAAAEMAIQPDARIIGYYSRSVMAISEGRMMPVTAVAPFEAARAQAHEHAQATTAALVEAAMGAGAVCASLPPALVETLARYGHDLGMALHLAAEADDYEGPGLALRSGVITLPLIYAIDDGGTALARLLDRPPTEEALAGALAEVRRRGGVARTRAEAYEYARRAAAGLDALPASPERDALAALAHDAGGPERA
jgi:geranylgeranyl pyrophosphate synthase